MENHAHLLFVEDFYPTEIFYEDLIGQFLNTQTFKPHNKPCPQPPPFCKPNPIAVKSPKWVGKALGGLVTHSGASRTYEILAVLYKKIIK